MFWWNYQTRGQLFRKFPIFNIYHDFPQMKFSVILNTSSSLVLWLYKSIYLSIHTMLVDITGNGNRSVPWNMYDNTIETDL